MRTQRLALSTSLAFLLCAFLGPELMWARDGGISASESETPWQLLSLAASGMPVPGQVTGGFWEEGSPGYGPSPGPPISDNLRGPGLFLLSAIVLLAILAGGKKPDSHRHRKP